MVVRVIPANTGVIFNISIFTLLIRHDNHIKAEPKKPAKRPLKKQQRWTWHYQIVSSSEFISEDEGEQFYANWCYMALEISYIIHTFEKKHSSGGCETKKPPWITGRVATQVGINS